MSISMVKRAIPLLITSPPPNRRGCSYALTVITPVYPRQVENLRKLLRGFELRARSPLHEVPDVQFARWVVIDQVRTDWPGAPMWPSRIASPYLLFSADLTAPPGRADGLPETFFRDLAQLIPAECAAVWGKCRGFPGVDPVDDFIGYLRSSQIDMGAYYAAFPDATPDQIKRALKIREKLAEFVLAHPEAMTVSPASKDAARLHRKLKDEYHAQSPSWET